MISYQAGTYALFFLLSFLILAFSVMMLFSRNFVHSAMYFGV